MSRGIRSIKPAVASLALALVLAAAGRAQSGPVPIGVFVAVDEYGNGTIQFFLEPGVPVGGGPLNSAMIQDPGPGGLPFALTYDLGGPPQIVPGDVLLTDPDTLAVSDILRFNAAGTFGNPEYPASLVFYSDYSPDEPEEPGVLADTGFPTALYYDNIVLVPEIGTEDNNYADYMPGPGQPGFVPGYSVVYHFVSDGQLPEPASLSLLALGSVALLKRRR